MDNEKGAPVARSEITLGFVGSGKVEKRNAFALLRDLIDASGGNAKFVFPLTKTFWNPALEVVSDFAIENSIPVEAIVDDTTAKVKELKSLLGGARRQHQSAAPAYKLASLLEEARDGKLIVLWDDEDEDAMDAVRAAHEKGIPLLELTRGLDRIELVTDDEEDEEEPISDELPEDETAEEFEAEEEIPVSGSDNREDEEMPVEEEEFEEAEVDDDIEAAAEAEESEGDDLPVEEEEEEFSLPEEDEADMAVLDMEQDIVEEVRQVTGMSEFQRRLLAVLEKTSEAFVRAVEAALAEEGLADQKLAAAKPAPSKPTKKSTTRPQPVEKPAAKAASKPAVKRSVPAKKAAPKAEENGTGKMTKAAAQKIIDSYRPRRGRPPAEVTEARKILGLA